MQATGRSLARPGRALQGLHSLVLHGLVLAARP